MGKKLTAIDLCRDIEMIIQQRALYTVSCYPAPFVEKPSGKWAPNNISEFEWRGFFFEKKSAVQKLSPTFVLFNV